MYQGFYDTISLFTLSMFMKGFPLLLLNLPFVLKKIGKKSDLTRRQVYTVGRKQWGIEYLEK